MSKKNSGAVNAKNIEFDRPGAGIEGYGITPKNLNAKLVKLYGARTEKDGGSKSIWDAMVKNTGKSLARQPNSVAGKQFNEFLRTGKMPAKPDPGFQRYAAESLDYGLRETGRSQQHKPTSFLSGFLTDLLPEIALGFVPGVGPALAATYGGIKGGVENGVLGAITGAAGGYGAGSLGSGVSSIGAESGGWSGFLDNPGQFLGNVGRNAVDAAGNAVNSFTDFVAHPIDSLTGAGAGTLSNVNNFMPADIAARSTTSAGALAGAGGNLIDGATGRVINAAAPIANTASIIDRAINLAGIAAPIVGGIQASSAAKSAAKAQTQASNAAIDEQRRQFDVTQGNLAPYLNAGKETLPVLLDRIGVGPKAKGSKTYGSLIKPFTGADLKNEPGYRFELAQGEQGINRAASAAGRYDSGAVLKSLARFNNDYAGTKYNEAFNRDAINKTDTYNKLAGVAGTGQAAANQIATTGASNANAISELLTGAGNAKAAGIVGSSNAINNGVTGAYNNYQQNRLLQMLANNGSGNYSWGP